MIYLFLINCITAAGLLTYARLRGPVKLLAMQHHDDGVWVSAWKAGKLVHHNFLWDGGSVDSADLIESYLRAGYKITSETEHFTPALVRENVR